jgi:hypothetical protein
VALAGSAFSLLESDGFSDTRFLRNAQEIAPFLATEWALFRAQSVDCQ